MAHFAEITDENIVKRVIVVNDDDCLDENGIESEQYGAAFCSQNFGGTWKQCSYNGNIRKNFPATGFIYRQDIDAFVSRQPFPSWVLNLDTAQWEPPISYPKDENLYRWNEFLQQWDQVILGE
jgi:hypothetical protein